MAQGNLHKTSPPPEYHQDFRGWDFQSPALRRDCDPQARLEGLRPVDDLIHWTLGI